MKIPKFILNQVFLKDSFLQSAEGIQFAFVNRLGPGVLAALHKVKIGEAEFGPEVIRLQVGERCESAAAVSEQNPLKVLLNETVQFFLDDVKLPEGPYTISFDLHSVEMGPISFSFDATLQPQS